MNEIRLPLSGPDEAAQDVFQAVLDVTTPLVQSGDIAAYREHVKLPFVFRTAAGESVNETEADLVEDVGKIKNWLRGQGVTDFFRLARRARFLSEDRIEGFYVTYALRKAVMVIEPYSNRMIIERNGDGRWLCAFSEHELKAPLYPTNKGAAAHGLFRNEWEGRIGDLDDAETEAQPIYQAFLDANSDHIMARDFNTWVADFTIPHEVHFDSVDHVVTAPGDVRPFFDSICEKMDMTGADCFVRHSHHATFLSSTRIFGYHDTTLTRDGTVCFGPIRSRMILTCEGGRWRCRSVTNSLSNTGFRGGELQASDLLPTLREIEKRMNT